MIIIEKAKKLKDLLKEDYLYTLETMLQDGFTVEGAISLMYDFYIGSYLE